MKESNNPNYHNSQHGFYLNSLLMRIILILLVFVPADQFFAQRNLEILPIFQETLMPFPNVRDFTISSSEDEAYFTAQSLLGEVSVILTIRKKDNKWSSPEIVSFSGKYRDLEPFLSSDGLKLFFASNRPLKDGEGNSKNFDIWYVERYDKNSKWSNPKNIGNIINTGNNEFYPSVSNNNNIYFTSDRPNSKGKDDIFVNRWEEGHYTPPVSLSDSVNSDGYEFNAFIAPDESFIIFSGYNRKDGLGSGDLYISRKRVNGKWTQAKNLGSQINSVQMDYCPFVNMHTNTLYFTSKRSEIKYEDAGFADAEDLLTEVTKYKNGFSRLYKINIYDLLSLTEIDRK